MNKIDYLITGGCSFSQLQHADITWPIHLEKYLSPNVAIHTGKASAGNRTISRLVLLEIFKALEEGVDPRDMFVAVMWSGVNRHDVYTTDADFPHTEILRDPETHHYTPLMLNCDERNLYLLNAHWEDLSSKMYYENFYDELGSYIATLEHVLRVQWFLQSLGINYFMTEYSFDCIHQTQWHTVDGIPHNPPPNYSEHPDANILFSMVDWNQWLPVKNMSHWVESHKIPYSRPGDFHPSTEAHTRFTNEIIIPHMQNLGHVE